MIDGFLLQRLETVDWIWIRFAVTRSQLIIWHSSIVGENIADKWLCPVGNLSPTITEEIINKCDIEHLPGAKWIWDANLAHRSFESTISLVMSQTNMSERKFCLYIGFWARLFSAWFFFWGSFVIIRSAIVINTHFHDVDSTSCSKYFIVHCWFDKSSQWDRQTFNEMGTCHWSTNSSLCCCLCRLSSTARSG